MKHVIKFSVFLLILCAWANLASAQERVKQLPDDAKQEQLKAAADEALAAKMEAYFERMGFDPTIPFEATGDPTLDRRAYETAKSNWIANNPAEYQARIDAMTIHRPADAKATSATSTARPSTAPVDPTNSTH